MDRRLSRRELLELGARAGALAATAPLIGSLACRFPSYWRVFSSAGSADSEVIRSTGWLT